MNATFEKPELPEEEVGAHALTILTRAWVRLFGFRVFSRPDTDHAHIYVIFRRAGRYYHAGFTVRLFDGATEPKGSENA